MTRQTIRYTWVGIAILLLVYALTTLIRGATEQTVDSPLRLFLGRFTYAYIAMVISAAILASIWYMTHEH